MNALETQQAIDVMAAYMVGKHIEWRGRSLGQVSKWTLLRRDWPGWDWVHSEYRVALTSLAEVAQQAPGTTTPFASLTTGERLHWQRIARAVNEAVLARL